jgi:hypothetical protein
MSSKLAQNWIKISLKLALISSKIGTKLTQNGPPEWAPKSNPKSWRDPALKLEVSQPRHDNLPLSHGCWSVAMGKEGPRGDTGPPNCWNFF